MAKIVLGLLWRHAHPRKKHNLHTRLSLTKCIVLFVFKNKDQQKQIFAQGRFGALYQGIYEELDLPVTSIEKLNNKFGFEVRHPIQQQIRNCPTVWRAPPYEIVQADPQKLHSSLNHQFCFHRLKPGLAIGGCKTQKKCEI